MAIIGLTHGTDGKLENKVVKYRGKISTGWGPHEGPNTRNSPAAAGQFIAMREATVNERVGGKVLTMTKWVENKEIQDLLKKMSGSETPRLLEFVCLYKSPEDMWESKLSYFNSDGLVCSGNGIGTEAKVLTYSPDGDRIWKARPCGFTECPDYIGGKCKPSGVMKIYPSVDSTPPNPYKFETHSIITISNIESSLEDIWNLLRMAHAVKELEAGHALPFDGMFGLKMYLAHRKTKSGGKDVYVTDLIASKEFRDNIMKVISRAIDKKTQDSALVGADGSFSLLDTAASVMIQEEVLAIEDATVIEEDAIGQDVIDALNSAAETLLGE